MPSELSYIHAFLPAKNVATARTLLLLHGTGGNEHDLVPFGQMLDPAANILSPRGKVLENGMPRFFRRLAEGVFDIEDLRARTHELADFVGDAAVHYGLDPQRVIAIGYSNGANTAASLLLLRPEVLHAAVLLRVVLPLTPETLPDLHRKSALILAGEHDEMMPREKTEQLAEVLTKAGAKVTLQWQPTGHRLTPEDGDRARQFLKTV